MQWVCTTEWKIPTEGVWVGLLSRSPQWWSWKACKKLKVQLLSHLFPWLKVSVIESKHSRGSYCMCLKCFLKYTESRSAHLKLQFHSCHRLSSGHLGELLDVGVQVAGRDFCVATDCSFQQGLVDEYVLILCLHHVVPLSSHARHMTVYVHRLLVFHPLQHGVNHNKAARPAHTGTDGSTERKHRCQTRDPWALHIFPLTTVAFPRVGNSIEILMNTSPNQLQMGPRASIKIHWETRLAFNIMEARRGSLIPLLCHWLIRVISFICLLAHNAYTFWICLSWRTEIHDGP